MVKKNEMVQVAETQSLAKQPPVWLPSWQDMVQIGDTLAKSGLMPNYLNTPPKIVACLLVARDMGLPPSVVMRGGLYPVNGIISANGALIMAVLQRSGLVDIQIKQDPAGDWAEVTMKRRDSDLEHTARWDEKRVQESKANWDHRRNQEKATWRFHRMTMKTWRAITEAGRFVGSDLLMGLGYTHDELDVPCRVEDGDIVIDATMIEGQEPSSGSPPGNGSGKQGKDEVPRPAKPAQVKKWLVDKAAKYRLEWQTDGPASEKQVGLAAGKLEEVWAGDEDAEKKRRSLLKYVFGPRDSLKQLNKSEVSSVLDWLILPKDEQTGDYPLNPLAASEARMILREYMEDSGQMVFSEAEWGGDHAPPTDEEIWE